MTNDITYILTAPETSSIWDDLSWCVDDNFYILETKSTAYAPFGPPISIIKIKDAQGHDCLAAKAIDENVIYFEN